MGSFFYLFFNVKPLHLIQITHFNFLSVDAIELFSGISAEATLQVSKEVIATMGEWELVGIASDLQTIRPMDGSSYQELHFYVRPCKNLYPLKFSMLLSYTQ